MPRFWPFRSVSNFALTIIGVSAVGFYGVGMYKQQYFANPVVAQAVKILGKNEKVKQIIGYPLSYQSSTKNKYNQNGNELYFSFKVLGPRGTTQVQVTATQLKAKDVYEYDQKNQPLQKAFEKLAVLKTQLVQTLQQKSKLSKPTSWFGNKNQQKIKQLQQIIQAKSKQIEQTNQWVAQTTAQKTLRKNDYYIPQKQYYTEIVSQNGKDNQSILPETTTLYKLQNIACQLPNKSRINVLNSGKAVQSQQSQTILEQKVKFQDLRKPVYSRLHEKMSVNVAGLSDEQIEQYSKHKTNFMYQRYNMYRILAFMVFLIGSGAVFIYFNKNKTKSLSNSVFYQLVLNKIQRDNRISEFLKRNHLKKLDLDKNVGGGMKNNSFICQIGVNNVTMGRLQIEGKVNSKTGVYDYNKFIFKYVENNENKQLDLLK